MLSPRHPLTAPALLSPIRTRQQELSSPSPARTAIATPSPLRGLSNPTVASDRTTLAAVLEPHSPTEAELAQYSRPQLEARESLRRLARQVRTRMGTKVESVSVRDARLRYVRYAKAVIAAKLKADLWSAHHQAAESELEQADVGWQAAADEQAALLVMMSPEEVIATEAAYRRAAEAFRVNAFTTTGESPELGPRATEYISFHTELWGWLDPSELSCIFWVLGSDYDEFEEQLVELGIEKDHARYLSVQMISDARDALVPAPAHIPTH